MAGNFSLNFASADYTHSVTICGIHGYSSDGTNMVVMIKGNPSEAILLSQDNANAFMQYNDSMPGSVPDVLRYTGFAGGVGFLKSKLITQQTVAGVSVISLSLLVYAQLLWDTFGDIGDGHQLSNGPANLEIGVPDTSIPLIGDSFFVMNGKICTLIDVPIIMTTSALPEVGNHRIDIDAAIPGLLAQEVVVRRNGVFFEPSYGGNPGNWVLCDAGSVPLASTGLSDVGSATSFVIQLLGYGNLFVGTDVMTIEIVKAGYSANGKVPLPLHNS